MTREHRPAAGASLVQYKDDGDTGFTATGGFTFQSGQGYQNDIRYAAAGSGSETATWSFTGLTTGVYRVSATWTTHTNRATNAPFSVNGGAAIPVNQQVAPSDLTDQGVGWKNLGDFNITAGSISVQLTDHANGYVIADAIRIERLMIIDDGDAGFSATSGFMSLGGQGYQNDVRYAAAGTGSETATWTFGNMAAGTYRVSATWTTDPNRATNAPFTVLDNATPVSTVAVNQVLAPNDFTDQGVGWKILGDFTITSGTLAVRLSNQANGLVIADAVRIERLNGVYVETLTSSALPDAPSGTPTGNESLTGANTLQTLTRHYTNNAAQLIHSDRYVNLTGLTYSTHPLLVGALEGTAYTRTVSSYDSRGRLNRVKGPTGTIERSVYDSRGRVISSWIGTDETGATHTNPAGSGSNNMKQVSASQYDGGGVGDGNLTRFIEYPSTRPAGTSEPTDARVRRNFFDWRNRLVATKSGVAIDPATGTDTPASEVEAVNRLIIYREYDNLNRATAEEVYDGDTVTIVDTSPADGVPDKPAQTRRRARSTTSFDVQGRVYRTDTFDIAQVTGGGPPPRTAGDASSNSLRTNVWYDKRGNVIKSAPPGGLVTKNQYDGAGRVTKTFATDGFNDNIGDGWVNAGSVNDDNVLQQAENTYDGNSNVIRVTTRLRFHDAILPGPLGDRDSVAPIPKARVSHVANYYDKADRMTDILNVGTFNGLTWNRPSAPPIRSDNELITSYAFNAAGWLETMTDPRGIQQKTEYDHAGRRTKTIEASTGGVPTTNTNRTTEFTYDGMDHVLTLKAILPDDPPGTPRFQTTQYVYGVTSGTGGSDIDSNDLLKEVRYPDKLTGNPSTAEGDVESYAYNALDQLKTKKQRVHNTVPVPHVPQTHSYSYDVLGRQTADAVTELGTGVDNAVRRIETAYDDAGRPFRFTSHDAASGGMVKNQVERTFNGLGQLISEAQAVGGAVDGSTPKVQYAYSFLPSGTNNHSRLVSMTYPNGRVLNYNYTGLDDTISRLTSLSDTSATLESYTYVGLGTVVRRAHSQPNIDLTYIMQSGESVADAGDQYTGLDRFGRVADQRWLRPGETSPIQPALGHRDRFSYFYDRNGNRQIRFNLTDRLRDELYHVNGVVDTFDAQGLLVNAAYDRLNQLTHFSRGRIDITGTSVPDPNGWQSYTLDAQGNWATLTTNGTVQNREHNQQNQVTRVGLADVSFDNNGNITVDYNGQTYKYDAWNRLVEVRNIGGSLLVTNRYDGMNRRNGEIVGTTTTDLYYSDDWQVLEERIGTATKAQYVWSPVYVDALVLRDRDTGGPSDLDERLYVQQDANWNVTALVGVVGPSWDVVERYIYEPFGGTTALDANWVPRPGGSAYGFRYLFQGGRYDRDIGLYHFRNRDFSPGLGRWLQRDPIEYEAGDTNLYRFVSNSPTNFTDPTGEIVPFIIVGALIGGGAGGLISWLRGDCPKDIIKNILIGAVLGGAGGGAIGAGIRYGPGILAAGRTWVGLGGGGGAAASNPGVQHRGREFIQRITVRGGPVTDAEVVAAIRSVPTHFARNANPAQRLLQQWQRQVDALRDKIAQVQEAIESIRNQRVGHGQNRFSGSEQYLLELARELADLMAARPH